MNKIAYTLAVFLGIISVSHADDTFVIDTDTLREETLNKAHQKISNYFELLDLDGNGKLSESECAGSSEGFENIPMFSPEELSKLKKKIDSAFSRFDKDQDKYLNKEEAQTYFTYIENTALDMQIAKMDPNGDGNITDDEMMQLTKQMPSFEESMAKLEEATQKLQEMNKNPEQTANQFISNIGSAVTKEQSAQMDADNNNKITKQEYVDYMFNHPDNKELNFSEQDYQDIYDLIDVDKKGYITQQQYLDYQQQELQKSLEDIDGDDTEIIEQETQKIDEKAEEPNNNETNVDNDEIVDDTLDAQNSPLLIEENAE